MSPDDVTTISKGIKDIKDLLLGTYDKRGMIAKVQDHDEWIIEQKRSRRGIISHIYKVVIMLVLSYIALKIGM